MGFFSYICKECGHSILSPYSVDPEINAWMKDAVVLSPCGSRVIGEYDGYGRVGGGYEDDHSYDGVWLHQACWEKAGKPEYDHYDGPSKGADDQGYFFRYEHDVIDPRITDLAERVRLLDEGKTARAQRWYDGHATDVYEWLYEAPEWKDPEDVKEPWRQRFSYRESIAWDEEKDEPLLDENGKRYKEGFNIWDKLDSDAEYPKFMGTENELKAHLAAKWATFVESDECRAYIVRAEELRGEARLRRLAELKEEGRYEASRRLVRLDDGKMQAMWYVEDKMHYQKVGNEHPGTWGRDEVQKDAKRLNDEWAAAGYPWEEREDN